METRIVSPDEQPRIRVTQEDLKVYLLAYHTVQLMLLQGFDPDPYPSLKLTIDGEERWSYGVEPFGSDVLRVILRSKKEHEEVLIFVLLKGENDLWRLGDSMLAADEDDWGRPAPQAEVQLTLKALG